MKQNDDVTDYVRDNVRKLCLWSTRAFKPIISHDELESIMNTLGFVVRGVTQGLGGVWKEYGYSGARTWMPRPKLPYPRVDGLHMLSYVEFLDAVNFYPRMGNVGDLFHVRELKLHRVYDRNDRWRRMEDEEYSVFVYRVGTIEEPVEPFHLRNYQKHILDAYSENDSMLIRKRETSTTTSRLIPLNDIIVLPDNKKLDS